MCFESCEAAFCGLALAATFCCRPYPVAATRKLLYPNPRGPCCSLLKLPVFVLFTKMCFQACNCSWVQKQCCLVQMPFSASPLPPADCGQCACIAILKAYRMQQCSTWGGLHCYGLWMLLYNIDCACCCSVWYARHASAQAHNV